MFTDPAKRMCCVIGAAVCWLVLLSPCWVQGQVVIDFEDEDFDQWVVVDEPPENLGEQGPSTWEIRESDLDVGGELNGMVLYQGSNIWGEPEDHMLTGTIIYFADQQFTNFTLEMDVIANDNDGMGPVWGFTDLEQHYRIQMINDGWPADPALDGHIGPMIIAHKRISNETPWYELIEVAHEPDYIQYPQNGEMHWTLEVQNGQFTFTSEDEFGDVNEISGAGDSLTGYVGIQLYAQQAEFDNVVITPVGGATQLQPGDADQDLDFDQLDLVQVQIAAKYLTGVAATWGEGDWNAAPGGEQGNPPPGNGFFDQLDIISALSAGKYLTGPYAAIPPEGHPGDGQTSVVYNVGTGEVAVDAPAGTNLTSINIDSASGIFVGHENAQNLDGSFDTHSANNVFKATFGSSFGSLSFGTIAQTGLAEDVVAGDLSVIGSLEGGGGLGEVDLVYVPEPTALMLLAIAALGLLTTRRRTRG